MGRRQTRGRELHRNGHWLKYKQKGERLTAGRKRGGVNSRMGETAPREERGLKQDDERGGVYNRMGGV